ncbi:MAG: hypothetical protein K6E66_00655 [Lachnospiraceae bacterium]|jgi:hypothetical protein|nr:hypothetical protein [Lachnospiraceae bacterium]
MSKVYVDVTAKFDKDGRIEPVQISWTDGTRFRVDKVLNVCRAVSTEGGGTGIRYTCRICGKNAFVFYSEREHRWFVEGKGTVRSDWVYTVM